MVDNPPEIQPLVLVPLHTLTECYAAYNDTDGDYTHNLVHQLVDEMSPELTVRTDDEALLTIAGVVVLTTKLAKHAIPSQRAADRHRETGSWLPS